jgi:ABC-type glutathione transport system ATPase component
MADALLEVVGMSKTYGRKGGVPALDRVSIRLDPGEAVGIVGESGAGKSTLMRCLLNLEHPDEGRVTFDGSDVTHLRAARLREYRRKVQVVFQDPAGSLNPRMSVDELISEGITTHRTRATRTACRERVAELVAQVGLPPAVRLARPGQLSGGQLQRVAIARALAVEPVLLICDEPTSALDVSVQAQILNLLADMRQSLGLSILLVSHNLAVVRYLCSRLYVLKSGQVVEAGERDRIFGAPGHEYTRELLAAVPRREGL